MASSFGTIKTNVGNRVGDTSTPFATIIGTYINQRYKEVLRRFNYSAINPDFALTATSAGASYTLPSDFGKELYVWNSVTTEDIPYIGLEKLEQEYQDDVNSSGTIEYYSIYDALNTTAASAEASAARIKKIRFWRSPSSDTYFTIPYQIRPSDLSSSTDQLVMDCETAVEYGATSDAWMYKRQFAKAQYYEQLFEKAIANLMWDKENNTNIVPQMNVLPLSRDEGL